MRPLERIHSRSPFLGILRWNRLVDRTNGLICPRQFVQRNIVANPSCSGTSLRVPRIGPPYPMIYLAFFLVKSLAQPLLSQRWLNRLIDDPQFPPKTANQLSSLLEGDDAGIFEIDRSNLVLQLRTLRRTINEGAEELDMVAIESVFVKSVSRALTRAANKLYLAAERFGWSCSSGRAGYVPKRLATRAKSEAPQSTKSPD